MRVVRRALKSSDILRQLGGLATRRRCDLPNSAPNLGEQSHRSGMDSNGIQMHESPEWPEYLEGFTYQIKTPMFEYAL